MGGHLEINHKDPQNFNDRMNLLSPQAPANGRAQPDGSLRLT